MNVVFHCNAISGRTKAFCPKSNVIEDHHIHVARDAIAVLDDFAGLDVHATLIAKRAKRSSGGDDDIGERHMDDADLLALYDGSRRRTLIRGSLNGSADIAAITPIR